MTREEKIKAIYANLPVGPGCEVRKYCEVMVHDCACYVKNMQIAASILGSLEAETAKEKP